MCGITGFLARNGFGSEAGECVRRMTRTLAHRGPDREGTWLDPVAGIALGHRRLSVVDLSAAGDQPMLSESGRYAIVFNGEIYNFSQLRRRLETSGMPAFRGRSDTEVMLACFERYGVRDAIPHFNGMFAFAVWDRQDRCLHLARDPLGEKPLYYGWAGDSFLFGSELKALRAHPGFRAEIDRKALALYLGYGNVPAPYSIYGDVFKLEPGCLLTLRPGAWEPHIDRHWSFKTVVEESCGHPFKGSDQEATDRLEDLLSDAVRLRMVADVPLGAFLSGGIDSSLVVALMQSHSERPVKTFTIGFHEEGFDEAVAAKKVAEHLGTDHTEWYVTPREAMAVIPKLPALYDEPFADSSQIPTHLVSELARRHVTVSLSGDGGDELFGGYTRYTRMQWFNRRLRLLPAFLPQKMARTADALPPAAGWHRLRTFAALAKAGDPIERYLAYARLWLGSEPLVRGIPPCPLLQADWPRCEDRLHQFMAVDTLTYLPDDILVKVDRAAMGVSLESRIPLLDTRVVEFAWNLPCGMKVRRRETKWILRQILDKYVPRPLVDRPKSGFSIPVAAWLRGPLRDWAENLLDDGRIRGQGLLEPGPIRSRWREHLAGNRDHSPMLWAVLMFQAWLESEEQPATEIPAVAVNAV